MHRCTAGQIVPCEVAFYNENANADNQTACRPCPNFATTIGTASSSLMQCLCTEGYFNIASSSNVVCEPCPLGTTCTELGATVATLPIKPGYYRASETTANVVRCFDAGAGCGSKTECANSTSACRGGSVYSLSCQPGLR